MKNNLLISSLLVISLLFGCTATKPDRIVNQERPTPAEVSPINTRGQADQAPVQRKAEPKPQIKKAPFSASIRFRIDTVNTANISQIQYYISKGITLRRSDKVSDVYVDDDGKVVMTDGNQETEIFIPLDLQGTLKDATTDTVMISFSISDDRFLTFSKRAEENGIYYLDADWDEMGYGKIKYGGEDFTILPGGEVAYLMFGLERVSSNKTAKKTEEGRLINTKKDGHN